MDLREISLCVEELQKDRDWDQYLHPKDILLAMVSEVGELADLYRWLDDDQIRLLHDKDEVSEEMADILMFLITLARKSGVDLEEAVLSKMEKIKLKYPVEEYKGIHTNKYVN